MISWPTPIWSGVKGIIANNGSTLLLTIGEGVAISSTITSTLMSMVTTNKGRSKSF